MSLAEEWRGAAAFVGAFVIYPLLALLVVGPYFDTGQRVGMPAVSIETMAKDFLLEIVPMIIFSTMFVGIAVLSLATCSFMLITAAQLSLTVCFNWVARLMRCDSAQMCTANWPWVQRERRKRNKRIAIRA